MTKRMGHNLWDFIKPYLGDKPFSMICASIGGGWQIIANINLPTGLLSKLIEVTLSGACVAAGGLIGKWTATLIKKAIIQLFNRKKK